VRATWGAAIFERGFEDVHLLGERYPSQVSAKLRIGAVPYLVARPINYGLEDEPTVEYVRDVPARLIERLRRGALDVALVSSIELFRAPGYGYLAGPVVAGQGYVASVQLFLRRPVGELGNVLLDPSSRAAQALLAITLASRERGAQLDEVDPKVDVREAAHTRDAGGWLRIGDRALVEALSDGAPPCFNPSEAWARDTGLPFVFAAWVVRPGVALSSEHLALFRRARERGAAEMERLASEAAAAWALPLAACRKYLLEECWYEPGAKLEPALLAFRDRAAALGLCDGGLTPHGVAL
jgi:chorismate dehydratase